MNYYTSTSKTATNFQTKSILIVRFLREEQAVVGKVMLVDGVVKRNMCGKTSQIKVCRTEDERIEALKEFFNITLTEEEKEGVKGRNVELLP